MTEIKKLGTKVGNRSAIYGEGNVFKSLLIMSVPVVILMFTNVLYQFIDAAMSANLVSYDVMGKEYSGSMVSMFTVPVMLIMMAAISLTNMGFGTIFSQRLGAKDEEGAKIAISTMHYTNIIIIILALLFSFLLIHPWLNWIIPNQATWDAFVDAGIVKDAKLSMIVYAIAISISSFHGIASRQIRSEGHIKAASYLPMISIPFNILFDFIFMGPLGMNVVGAALATLISVCITSVIIFSYIGWLSKRNETLFSLSVFKLGVDWSIFFKMVAIGILPFAIQIGRAYNQILSLYLYSQVGGPQMLQLFSAISRPTLLILMPAFAMVQTGGAMIGYNFGAKNHTRVNESVRAMFILVILLALPQYIVVMFFPKLMFWMFGALPYINAEMGMQNAKIAYWLYLSLSIISAVPSIMITYYMSTQKQMWGLLQVLTTFIISNTVVILIFFFTVGQQEGMEHLFFGWYPMFTIFSQLLSWPVFIYIMWKDNKKLIAIEKEMGILK